MTQQDGSAGELTTTECWELLEGERFGRLAFRLADEVHLVPINYLVDHRRLLFNTQSGNKLLAAALQSDVAFEIDWRDDRTAWSVVARGRIRELSEPETDLAELLPIESWVPILERHVLELVPTAVTGRRFHLQRPEADHAAASA